MCNCLVFLMRSDCNYMLLDIHGLYLSLSNLMIPL